MQLCTFEIVNGNLRITPNEEGRAMLAEVRETQGDDALIALDLFLDFIEHQLCNGWEEIRPEEIGALTDGTILTNDSERDEQRNLTYLGRVYWDSHYAVRSACRDMLDKGYAEFVGEGGAS